MLGLGYVATYNFKLKKILIYLALIKNCANCICSGVPVILT
jgi:hypothetical protein